MCKYWFFILKVYIGPFGAEEALNEDGEVIHDDQLGITASWLGFDYESGIVKYLIAVGTGEGIATTLYIT